MDRFLARVEGAREVRAEGRREAVDRDGREGDGERGLQGRDERVKERFGACGRVSYRATWVGVCVSPSVYLRLSLSLSLSVERRSREPATRTADELPEVKVAPLGKDVLQLRDGHDAQDLEVQVVEVLAELVYRRRQCECKQGRDFVSPPPLRLLLSLGNCNRESSCVSS